MINRIVLGATIGAVAAAGAVGLALGYTGTLSFSRGAEASVSTGSLTYFACPNTGALGAFSSGDRVYLTGQDDTGEWVQVRSPEDSTARVWIRSESVGPDEQVDLPVAGCSTEIGEFALGDAPSTTTTEVVEEEPEDEEPVPDEPDQGPTTTVPGTTPTVPPTIAPTTTAPPTTVPPTTAPSTTVPPTTTTSTTAPAPTIGPVSRSAPSIYEEDEPGTCTNVVNSVTTSTIQAALTNATSAFLTWSGVVQGSKPMSLQGGTATAVLGPFGQNAITSAPWARTLTVTIVATGPGGQSSASTTVTLNDCVGFG
jgi:hypothetical protein